MSESNFLPPPEAEANPRGFIESRIEGTCGILALSGEIVAELELELQSAVDEHLQNPDINCLIFDFESATFIDFALVGLIKTTHDRTMAAGTKLMTLRNIVTLDIQRLLHATGLDKRLAIEGKDDLEGSESWKLRFSSFKPEGH